MSTNNNNTECMVTCWGIAAFVGVVAMIMLYMLADFGVIQAIFTGGLIGTVLGLLLSLTVCSSQTAADDLASEEKPAARYAAKAAEEKAANATAAQAGMSAAAEAAGAAGTAGGSASAGGAGAADTASVAASNANASTSSAAATAAPASLMSSAATSEPAKAAPKAKTAPKAKAAPKAAAAPKAKAAPKSAAAADARPATLLDGPRPEGKDDLKLISGVGPKLEQTLNDLGVFHFDQVAKFKKQDIAWVDERLRFKGRIERDDWMSQAKILAKGGETEFSKGKRKS